MNLSLLGYKLGGLAATAVRFRGCPLILLPSGLLACTFVAHAFAALHKRYFRPLYMTVKDFLCNAIYPGETDTYKNETPLERPPSNDVAMQQIQWNSAFYKGNPG